LYFYCNHLSLLLNRTLFQKFLDPPLSNNRSSSKQSLWWNSQHFPNKHRALAFFFYRNGAAPVSFQPRRASMLCDTFTLVFMFQSYRTHQSFFRCFSIVLKDISLNLWLLQYKKFQRIVSRHFKEIDYVLLNSKVVMCKVLHIRRNH